MFSLQFCEFSRTPYRKTKNKKKSLVKAALGKQVQLETLQSQNQGRSMRPLGQVSVQNNG